MRHAPLPGRFRLLSGGFAVMVCLCAGSCDSDDHGPREYTTSVTIGDLDGDGLEDLFVVVRRREPKGCVDDDFSCSGSRKEVRGRVVWRIQDDLGGLGGRRRVEVGNRPRSMVLADLDRDGLADVAVANEQKEGTISLLLQNPAEPQKFRLRTYLTSASNPIAVSAGNLDDDGFVDLVAASPDNGLSLILQDPATPAEFLPEEILAASAKSALVEDIDGDGRDDILYTDGFEAVILFQEDDGSFSSVVLGEGTWPMYAAVGLLNGDSTLDVVVVDAGDEGAPETATVAVIFQSPGSPRSFEIKLLLPADEGAVQVQVGDLNADSDDDIAIIGETNAAFIYHQDTDSPGSYLPPQRVVVGKLPSALAIGDLNGDGKQDLAVSQWELDRAAQVFLQDPDDPGQFEPPFTVGK